MKRLAYSLLLLLLVPYANAQVRIQTFPLNKPITEQFVGCLEKKDAVDIVDAKQDLTKSPRLITFEVVTRFEP